MANRGSFPNGGDRCLVTGTWAWRIVLAYAAIGRSPIPANRATPDGGDVKSSVGDEGVIFKLSLSRACQRGHHYLAFYHIVVEQRAAQLETRKGREKKRQKERERESL